MSMIFNLGFKLADYNGYGPDLFSTVTSIKSKFAHSILEEIINDTIDICVDTVDSGIRNHESEQNEKLFDYAVNKVRERDKDYRESFCSGKDEIRLVFCPLARRDKILMLPLFDNSRYYNILANINQLKVYNYADNVDSDETVDAKEWEERKLDWKDFEQLKHDNRVFFWEISRRELIKSAMCEIRNPSYIDRINNKLDLFNNPENIKKRIEKLFKKEVVNTIHHNNEYNLFETAGFYSLLDKWVEKYVTEEYNKVFFAMNKPLAHINPSHLDKKMSTYRKTSEHVFNDDIVRVFTDAIFNSSYKENH